MRAAVITEFNKPWQIKDLPDPRPAAGQVVIRVRASGMCATDVAAHQGYLPVPTPFVAGHEPAGEIVEIGPGVTDLKVGDRVGVSWHQKGCGRCEACQAGHSHDCPTAQTWMNVGGGNSELMIAWASGCSLIPDGVSFEEAAPIFCAGYTSMSALRNANPKPGERVAVLGVGGLGHLALQFAKALGLPTIGMTAQANKTKELQELGADEVLVAGEDLGKQLMAIGGADIILSTTSDPKQVASAFTGLRAGGRFVNMGLVHGPILIDSMALMFPARQLIGSSQDERSDLYEALQLVAAGKVKPKLETYPLNKVNEVRDRLAAGKVRYRAVLQHAA
jgi:D-arabinose 1-dehydrogenase-like Zn-dependent alcohol dehydrogenase